MRDEPHNLIAVISSLIKKCAQLVREVAGFVSWRVGDVYRTFRGGGCYREEASALLKSYISWFLFFFDSFQFKSGLCRIIFQLRGPFVCGRGDGISFCDIFSGLLLLPILEAR